MASYESVVSELEEVKANFNQQCESTAENWDDDVKNRFYSKYVSGYSGKIDRYVSQVKDLGTFLEIRKKEMKTLVNVVK